MRQFLKNLLNGATDEVSSRRVVALAALVLIFVMALAHTFGRSIDSEIYIATVVLVAGALGFTLTNFKKS